MFRLFQKLKIPNVQKLKYLPYQLLLTKSTEFIILNHT